MSGIFVMKIVVGFLVVSMVLWWGIGFRIGVARCVVLSAMVLSVLSVVCGVVAVCLSVFLLGWLS